MKRLRIVYMGTPEFAVEPLKHLIKEGFDIAAVVTATDKPAGRGKEIHSPEVKRFAVEHGILVLQPDKLKDADFLVDLRELNADLFVVVAFRMLPDVVWTMPPKGTVNLHASLLPQYRGAAPINHAIINGDKETGVSTFFITHEIDTGEILMQSKVCIGDDETAGELHDKLMVCGSELLTETVMQIEAGTIKSYPQPYFSDLKPAPKIFKDFCKINWDMPGDKIHNLVRGLSPYPCAWAEFRGVNSDSTLKIFKTEFFKSDVKLEPGTIVTDKKTFVKVACNDGFINICELQVAGKKRLTIGQFLAGFRDIELYKMG